MSETERLTKTVSIRGDDYTLQEMTAAELTRVWSKEAGEQQIAMVFYMARKHHETIEEVRNLPSRYFIPLLRECRKFDQEIDDELNEAESKKNGKDTSALPTESPAARGNLTSAE